ncbi:disulfide bond formation protein B [Agaribacterium haliotis]|uniref:disulfide bond formation protein B n=1 Tax=Agaribacterium haliotis TaxID=2013869 RepID=UPI000BB571AF|nr:disulfide bond formation protein B [Agaribacterium haliotis]
MTQNLSRLLNTLGAIAIAFILTYAFFDQFYANDLPCPLCLLQRVAFIAVLTTLIANVIYGPKLIHYSAMILSAFMGATFALRQVSLHVIPGTPGYGEPFLGMHFYTWAFVVFALVILGATVMLSFNKQYQNSGYLPFGKQSALAKIAIALAVLVCSANMLAVFIECGPLECPANPEHYKLLNTDS